MERQKDVSKPRCITYLEIKDIHPNWQTCTRFQIKHTSTGEAGILAVKLGTHNKLLRLVDLWKDIKSG